MKPRLCSAALTREDWEILVDIREHHQRWHGSNLLAMSQHSDRRDADLMLELMKGRKTFRQSRRAYERLRRYALSVGGTKRDWPE
jgi:hypothetical protein